MLVVGLALLSLLMLFEVPMRHRNLELGLLMGLISALLLWLDLALKR
ncbi:MAG: hypothetical protein AMXMBFR33_18800 [Candidatus Xenobia bacterium]